MSEVKENTDHGREVMLSVRITLSGVLIVR
jgi:hypothetical protein